MAVALILLQQKTAGQQPIVTKSKSPSSAADLLQKNFPPLVDYVNDFAHVLSPAAVARLDSVSGRLFSSGTHTTLIVLTITTLGGTDIAEFAKELFNKWKIGNKDTNRGVLVLLAVNDHKWRIATGYGMEGILTDAKAAEIGRKAAPLLHANNFDGGVTLFVDQIVRVIAADAEVNPDDVLGKRPQL